MPACRLGTAPAAEDARLCRLDCTPELFRAVMPKALAAVSPWANGWGQYRQVDKDAQEFGQGLTWHQVCTLHSCECFQAGAQQRQPLHASCKATWIVPALVLQLAVCQARTLTCTSSAGPGDAAHASKR